MLQGTFRRLVPALAAALAGLFLMGSAVFAQQTTAGPGGAADPSNACANWTKAVQGRPAAFQAGAADGVYFWCGPDENDRDDRSFHLRTTDSAGHFRYSGVLRSDGTFKDVDKVRDEADDHVQVLDGGHALRFSFVTYQGIDGLNFNLAGATHLRLRLDRDGKRLDPANIFLGEDGVHPAHNPFAIHRHHERAPKRTAPAAAGTAAS